MATIDKKLRQRLERWGIQVDRKEYEEWRLAGLIPDPSSGVNLEVSIAEVAACHHLTHERGLFFTEVLAGRTCMGDIVENAGNPIPTLDGLRAFPGAAAAEMYEDSCEWLLAFLKFHSGQEPDEPAEILVRPAEGGGFLYVSTPSRVDRIRGEGAVSFHPRRRTRRLDDAFLKANLRRLDKS
jgi:hypothetical protein